MLAGISAQWTRSKEKVTLSRSAPQQERPPMMITWLEQKEYVKRGGWQLLLAAFVVRSQDCQFANLSTQKLARFKGLTLLLLQSGRVIVLMPM
jgi:hypothetical protein